MTLRSIAKLVLNTVLPIVLSAYTVWQLQVSAWHAYTYIIRTNVQGNFPHGGGLNHYLWIDCLIDWLIDKCTGRLKLTVVCCIMWQCVSLLRGAVLHFWSQCSSLLQGSTKNCLPKHPHTTIRSHNHTTTHTTTPHIQTHTTTPHIHTHTHTTTHPPTPTTSKPPPPPPVADWKLCMLLELKRVVMCGPSLSLVELQFLTLCTIV